MAKSGSKKTEYGKAKLSISAEKNEDAADLNILTDEELVTMAREGSATAEEFLIRKYMKVARGKVHKYFITGADTEDVIQEGMIGIFKAIRDYDDAQGASFHTFVELCVNRQIIKAMNKANRQKYQILNSAVSLSDDSIEGMPDLEDILADNNQNPEVLALINEFLEYLEQDGISVFSPMENRVWLKLREGMSYKEIASDLGKTPKSIDNCIQRIRKKIYNYL